jgi:D-beta-D-heptose 7-phosphate kinase/D-beta-D-heptose 1-phosphate adenosyltransferase
MTETMTHSMDHIFKDFSKTCILLLGDIMLDKYIYGNIERISPEAPVPVLLHQEEKTMLGGAGNVFRNLVALGGKRHVLFTAAGKDERRIHLKKLLANTAKYHLYIGPERETTLKLRMIAQDQQIIRHDMETVMPLSPVIRQEILSDYGKHLESADAVVLSDYSKGFFGGGFAQKIISMARKAGKMVLVDPKCRDFSVYSGADFVKPNRKELSEAAGQPSIQTIDGLIDAARSLCRKYSIGAIIVTLGRDGMLYVPQRGKAIHSRIEHTLDVFDVSGAGDTVLAVLALSFASGLQAPLAMHIANTAAQIAIGKSGAATVSPEEILYYLHSRAPETPGGNSLNKIVPLSRAKEFARAWKNNGETVCFTNGCFDLLHYGHISSFLQARKHGDRLIVALNSDKSVKKIKGVSRPIQDEKTRAALLAGLQCVDLVVVFDDDTALRLVRELHPDVIAKEGYSLEKWAEARFVQSYGGKAVSLKREKGYSTSALVGKIAKLQEPVK